MKVFCSSEVIYGHKYSLLLLQNNIYSGPIVAIILQKQNAVEDWRKALGPTDSIVAKKQDPKRFEQLYLHKS